MKMEKKNGFTVIEGVIILAIVLSLAGAFLGAMYEGNKKYGEEAYFSWCKLHQRDDFNYEEWKTARKAGLLDAPKESVPMMIPMPR